MKTCNKKFLKAFVKNPRQVGSVIESSPFLADQLVNPANFHNSKCIVELGSGTGSITRKILHKMQPDCTLLCFEIDKSLASHLQENLQDPRVKVICDSAENIGEHLARFGFEKADCVISGIPLASLPQKVSENIIGASHRNLKTGGKYIQFQYSLVSWKYLKQIFPATSINFVLLNIPPAFVYICIKM